MRFSKSIACEKCSLYNSVFVPPEGDLLNAKLVIIGEAPGEEEVRQGRPFVGKSGKLLRSVLEELGVEMNEVYITNVVKCRPPGNRTPTEFEVKFCSELFLKRELENVRNGCVVLALGSVAKGFLRIGGSMNDARGRVRELKKGVKAIVSWHPAYRGLFVRKNLLMTPYEEFVGDIKKAWEIAVGKEDVKVDYKVVQNVDDVIELAKECFGRKVAIDFETTSLNIFDKDFSVVCFGVCSESGKVFIIDERKFDKIRFVLSEILESSQLVFYNALFDLTILKKYYSFDFVQNVDDVMLMAYLLDGGVSKEFSLKKYASDFLGWIDYSLSSEEWKNVSKISEERLYGYCAKDVYATMQLCELFLKKLKNSVQLIEWSDLFGDSVRGLYDVYKEIMIPAVNFFSDVQCSGLHVDLDYLLKLKEELTSKMKQMEMELKKEVGFDLNVNSPQQVLRALRMRGIDVKSTSKEVLERYKDDRFVSLLLDYRLAMKFLRTYVDGLVEISVSSVDGRVHGRFSLVGTATGRVSCSEPNLMNIPTRFGNVIENAFVSRFGSDGVILKVDFSQHELRVAALYSRDENMIRAFRNGVDLHTEVAKRIYGLKDEDIGTEKEKILRRLAKGFNFGVIYGRSPASIAQELGISEAEAVAKLREYFMLFSGLYKWLKGVEVFVDRYGYVRSMFGRVRFLHKDIVKLDEEVDSGFVYRAGVNTPIQSAASDIALKVCCLVNEEMKRMGLQSKIVNFIHDAFLVDCLKEEMNIVKEIVFEIVKSISVPVRKLIDFEVEVTSGERWGECV